MVIGILMTRIKFFLIFCLGFSISCLGFPLRGVAISAGAGGNRPLLFVIARSRRRRGNLARAQGDDSIKGEIAVQQAMAAYRRFDIQLAGELARKALSLLPPDELENRSVMSANLGFIYYISGNFKEAER